MNINSVKLTKSNTETLNNFSLYLLFMGIADIYKLGGKIVQQCLRFYCSYNYIDFLTWAVLNNVEYVSFYI